MPQTPEERIEQTAKDLWKHIHFLSDENDGRALYRIEQILQTTHNNAIQMAMGKVPSGRDLSVHNFKTKESVLDWDIPQDIYDYAEDDGHNTTITQMNKGLSELIIEL